MTENIELMTAEEVAAELKSVSDALLEYDLDGDITDEYFALSDREEALEAAQRKVGVPKGESKGLREQAAAHRQAAAENAEAMKDATLSSEARGAALADMVIAQQEAAALEGAAPFAGQSDEALARAGEDARLAEEIAREKAAALPAGSLRRKRAEGEVEEAHARALHAELELRRRKGAAAVAQLKAARIAQLVEREIVTERERQLHAFAAEDPPPVPWELERLREQLAGPPSAKEIARTRVKVEAEYAEREREAARWQALRSSGLKP